MRCLDGITDSVEFEQAPGDGEGQGSLACCSPWGHRSRTRLSEQQQLHAWRHVYTLTRWWTLGVFHLLAMTGSTAVNVHVHVLCVPVFSFLLGTYLGVELLRYCPAVFQNSCSIFHSHQQCKRVPASLRPHQYLLLSDFFFFGHTACRIQFPSQGLNPGPSTGRLGS